MSCVIDTIEQLISELVNNFISGHFKNNGMFSSWDSSILRAWRLISLPSLPVFPRVGSIPICRNSIKWKPSDSPFIKLNFDGSSRGNPGNSGIGISLRNQSREVLAFYAKPIPFGTNNMAESTTLLEGLLLAKYLSFSCLHIEGDSSVVINACIHRKIINWQLECIFQRIWELIYSLESYLLSHVYREGNALVDSLANIGCDGTILDSRSSFRILERFPCIVSIIKSES